LDLVRRTNGSFETVVLPEGVVAYPDSVMRTVYENGKILVKDTLDDIRARNAEGR
jgi:hypothetical protein